jgi:hypothetical protein
MMMVVMTAACKKHFRRNVASQSFFKMTLWQLQRFVVGLQLQPL